jgi:hypothetical protein
MAPRHADMHLVDPQLWDGAVRCQKSKSKDFFSSLLEQHSAVLRRTLAQVLELSRE